MELTNEQKKKGIWLEIKDLFTGAAFPVMLQLILSASIILFVDALSEDTALQIVVLVIGELLFMGAYTIFGRQNGITAYRRTVQHAKKRELQADDLTCWLKTGDYAVWKGIVIGLITVIPFMFVQFIHCVAPNLVCEFILKYAFGWAAYPFIVIGQAAGELSQWLNYIWIVVPVGVHTAAYVWGASIEKKRLQKVAEAQEFKQRRK